MFLVDRFVCLGSDSFVKLKKLLLMLFISLQFMRMFSTVMFIKVMKLWCFFILILLLTSNRFSSYSINQTRYVSFSIRMTLQVFQIVSQSQPAVSSYSDFASRELTNSITSCSFSSFFFFFFVLLGFN